MVAYKYNNYYNKLYEFLVIAYIGSLKKKKTSIERDLEESVQEISEYIGIDLHL